MGFLSETERAFSRLLVRQRKQLAYSQEYVAAAIGVSQSTYAKWETERQPVPSIRVLKIKEILELPSSLCDIYISAAQRGQQYFSASYEELLEAGVSDAEIFDAVEEIYAEFPPALIGSPADGSNDFGGSEKWRDFVRRGRNSFRLIGRKGIAGYIAFWHAESIVPELYERGRQGKNINLEIRQDQICGFIIPRVHDLYFIDLFRKSAFNNPAANLEIISSFLGYLEYLADSGHYIRRILTHASTPEAEQFCLAASFDFLCEHEQHRRHLDATSLALVPTKIFELDVMANADRLMEMRPGLREKYRDRF